MHMLYSNEVFFIGFITMKKQEKERARKLRKKGHSISEIVERVDAAKGSVSRWVRDIELTKEQKQHLSKKGYSKELIEKRRKTRLENTKKRHNRIIEKGADDIENISRQELFYIGVALYWGEGSKKKNVIQFTNSDPKMIKVMMRFLLEVCEVSVDDMQGHVHLHPHLDTNDAEEYWSEVSDIPQEQFYKTSQQHNTASKNKKESLSNGTFSIYVCDTELALTMKGWMQGMHEELCN